jgi:hypothetical protein
VVKVHANSSRVISKSVWILIEPITSIGDNDSKLPEKVVGTLVSDDDRDVEVLAWRLEMMVKMYKKIEQSCKNKIK